MKAEEDGLNVIRKYDQRLKELQVNVSFRPCVFDEHVLSIDSPSLIKWLLGQLPFL